MSAQHIEEKILYCQQLGRRVFFVGITAGTTILGAFDPIEEIALVCRKYNVWLHVDVRLFFLNFFGSTQVTHGKLSTEKRTHGKIRKGNLYTT